MGLHDANGIKQALTAVGMGLLALPLVFYGVWSAQRPPQTTVDRSLFQGIVYRREAHRSPRPYLVHIITVDLTALGVRAFVTPKDPSAEDLVLVARTATEFAREFDLQLAVNANFFYPFEEQTPWTYYPHSGDRVSSIGQSISDGHVASVAAQKWPALCFATDHRAMITRDGICPDGTEQAVAGDRILVENGNPDRSTWHLRGQSRPYPRVAAAIDTTGQTLWLIVVDGKQPLYSQGVSIPELTAIALDLGADSAINLDGGGSTTLVANVQDGPEVLNAPIHTKWPMRERPVANHLGFYALPMSTD